MHDNGWTFVERTRDMDVFSRPDPSSPYLCYKAVAVLPASAHVVNDVFSSFTHRRGWDATFQDGRIVARHDATTQIQYLAFHGSWPAQQRDLCVMSRSVYAADKSIFLFTTSVEHIECPVLPAYVRGDLFVGAIHIRPLSARSSEVHFLFAFDPKLTLSAGGLQVLLVNKANLQGVSCVATVRQYIESQPHLFGDDIKDGGLTPATTVSNASTTAVTSTVAAASSVDSTTHSGRDRSVSNPVPVVAVDTTDMKAVDAEIAVRTSGATPQDSYWLELNAAERQLREEVTVEGERGGWKLHSRQNDVAIYTKSVGPVQYCKGYIPMCVLHAFFCASVWFRLAIA